jgi:hypothetical protein
VFWSEPQGTNVSTTTNVTTFTLGETEFGQKFIPLFDASL